MDHLTAFRADCDAALALAAQGEIETGRALLEAAWLRFVVACQEEQEAAYENGFQAGIEEPRRPLGV